jgi:sporulation-control protein spo0M
MKKLDLLKPAARPIFEHFLTALDKEGLRYSVLETLRSQEVQDAYYAQGRETFNEIIKLRKKAGLYPISLDEARRIITYAKY